MKKHWFNYIVYGSVIFLFVALIKADYLVLPDIKNYVFLSLSIVCLLATFFMGAVRWKIILGKFGLPVRLGDATASFGLSVFAKYIPGKIMIVVGKAGYINKKYGYTTDRLITVSLTDQMLSLWSGLLMGGIGLFFMEDVLTYAIIVLVLWVVLSLVIFTKFSYKISERLLNAVFKKRSFVIPALDFKKSLAAIPPFLIYWIFLSIGFYFLTASICPETPDYMVGLIMPVATTMGIVAIIAPGGLGVREGVILGLLSFYNIATEVAVSISVASRFWFLIGEVFIFLLGFSFDKLIRKTTPEQAILP